MRLLVTGATGFIGRGVVSALAARGYSVCSLVRAASAQVAGSNDYVIADLSLPSTDLSNALPGIDTVVHLAALTHRQQIKEGDPIRMFRLINVEATRKLALAAAKAGVRRFVFMSSIKVNGELTGGAGRPEAFRADDVPHPEDEYGLSKLEAEQALQTIARDTGLEIVVVRPPLVYGPGVGGNFLRLMRLVASGIPLPFGTLHNRRSLVSLGNLTDLIIQCITHPSAVHNIIMAADGEDLSTTELMRRLAMAMGNSVKLVPIPASLLNWGLIVLGQRHVSQRLCGSLQVDIGKTRELLSWEPPFSVDEGLQGTVDHYQQGKMGYKPHS